MHAKAASRDYREQRIINPLKTRTLDELDHDVTTFYTRVGLGSTVDLGVLIRGARIARDPRNLSEIAVPGVTPAELNVIEQEENSNFFQQTKQLKVTIMATACAAIIQGWQQSTINVTTNERKGWIYEFYGPELKYNKLYTAFINASPWLSGSMIGTWLSDPLQEGRFGRRPALFISAIFCIACVIGTAHANTPEDLLVCRLLLGIGIGSKASIAPVFAAEAAVDHLRGRILMMWQVFDTFGIFVGFVCALIVRDSWRVLLATATVPAIVLLFIVFICPESPRFLIRRGQYPEAFQSLRSLRGSDIQAARDLYYIHSQLQVETEYGQSTPSQPWYQKELYQEWLKNTNFVKRVWSLWSVPRNRRACVAACIVMASQQLCGMNVLSFYSSNLFMSAAGRSASIQEINGSWKKAKWFNFCYGFANFIFTLPAYLYIDTRGRRFLLLISLAGMTLSLAAVSSFFYISDKDVRLGLVTSFCIAIFTFLYSIGAGPIPFTLSAEVFPLALREVGMSFAVMVNFLGLGLLVLFVPTLTEKFGHNIECGHPNCPGEANLLFLFTGLNVLAFILSYLLVPGTQKVTLEEMNWIFNEKTGHHINEHLSHTRWIPDRLVRLRRSDGDYPLSVPMRHLDGVSEAV